MNMPKQDNSVVPVRRYVFGAVFIPQKQMWLMEGTYPGLVVEALSLAALLEKAAWSIRAIEAAEKQAADAEQQRLMQAH